MRQDQHTTLAKGQIVNTLVFVGHRVFASAVNDALVARDTCEQLLVGLGVSRKMEPQKPIEHVCEWEEKIWIL